VKCTGTLRRHLNQHLREDILALLDMFSLLRTSPLVGNSTNRQVEWPRAPRSPVITNFFMEDLEDRTLAQATHKPLCLSRYVDTFVIWPHGTENLERFLDHLNGLHGNIQFTVEMERMTTYLLLTLKYTGYRMAPWVIRSTENLPTLTST
jgi:hypothetical protein